MMRKETANNTPLRANSTTKSKSYLIKRLWGYLSAYKGLLFLSFFLTIISNVFALLGPALSGRAINAMGKGKGAVDFPVVFTCVGLMILFYFTSAVLNYGLSRIMIRLSKKVVHKMRNDVFSNLTRLPVSFFDTKQTGEIISTISYDIDTINASLANDVVNVISSSVTVIGSFAMMLSINPLLVLVFIVTLPISIGVTRYRARKVRPLFRLRSHSLAEMNGLVEESLTGHKTILSYHQEANQQKRFNVKNEASTDAYYNADYAASLSGPAMSLINNVSLALISCLGGALFILGKMPLGDISSFILYSRKFSGPINEFANILTDFQSAMAATERVFNLLDENKEKKDAPNACALKDIEGNLEFVDVSFSYEEGKEILKNLSFTARAGTTTAIVGTTGAGKTTIINLLMRFYDIDEGQILLDGKDIYTIKREDLRKAFSMVLQDSWLFNGTIYENLSYGQVDLTKEEIQNAAKRANIHSFIESLPDGYETVLNEGGVFISGGQKQLLTIARAMLLDSKMLILDEATSNVDTQTERTIHNAMLELMKGRTCFVIAHRLSTIVHADNILVIDDGTVAQMGKHQNLLAKEGIYQELYTAQFTSS